MLPKLKCDVCGNVEVSKPKHGIKYLINSKYSIKCSLCGGTMWVIENDKDKWLDLHGKYKEGGIKEIKKYDKDLAKEVSQGMSQEKNEETVGCATVQYD